jgi:hypothetical protein
VEEKHVEALLTSGSHFENATKQCVSNDPLAKKMSGVVRIHWREFIEELARSVEKKASAKKSAGSQSRNFGGKIIECFGPTHRAFRGEN